MVVFAGERGGVTKAVRTVTSSMKTNTNWKRTELTEGLGPNKGVVPFEADMKKWDADGTDFDFAAVYPLLMGQASAAIGSVETTEQIVDAMVSGAVAAVSGVGTAIISSSSSAAKL